MSDCVIITRQRILNDLTIALPSGAKIDVCAEDVSALFDKLGRYVGVVRMQELTRTLMWELQESQEAAQALAERRRQADEDRINTPC